MRSEIVYGAVLNYGRDAGECMMAQVAMCTSRWAKRTALPGKASESCGLFVDVISAAESQKFAFCHMICFSGDSVESSRIESSKSESELAAALCSAQSLHTNQISSAVPMPMPMPMPMLGLRHLRVGRR
jgi:hypothetical protein